MSLAKKLYVAIEDYASFPSEDLEQAVLAGLSSLEKELDNQGFEQSSDNDAAEAKIESEMNTADALAEETETE